MSSAITVFLDKVVGNANLDKLVTDLAPGILVAFSLILLVDTFTEVKVFPYSKLSFYEKNLEKEKAEMKNY